MAHPVQNCRDTQWPHFSVPFVDIHTPGWLGKIMPQVALNDTYHLVFWHLQVLVHFCLVHASSFIAFVGLDIMDGRRELYDAAQLFLRIAIGFGRPLHIGHMHECALRPSGYDFTTLYTIGGYSCQTHSGVSSRVLSPTLTCRVQVDPVNDIGSARQGNFTPFLQNSLCML